MLGLTYAAATIGGLRLPVDSDIWWHLRTAAWIVDHGAVPVTDSFSAYGTGKPWIAYSWLFEVMLLGMYKVFGLAGIVVFSGMGALAVAVAFHRLVARYEKRVPRALALTLVGVAAIMPVFWPRSYVFSIVLFIVLLYLILVVRESGNRKPLLFVPLVMAVWANLHIQFVYGLYVLGAATAAPILERYLPETWTGSRSAVGARPFFVAWVAAMAATLATPYHVWLYRPLLEHVAHAATFDLINELRAPLFRDLSDWTLLGLTLAATFVLGRTRTAPPFLVLLLCAGVFVSFRALRDVWFVVIVSAVIIVSSRHAARTPRYRLTGRAAFTGIALSASAVAAFIVIKDFSPRALEAAVAANYPVAAAKVVEERGYAGPLFNTYDWGGYLIWRLPGWPVSMDGRANLYGPDRILSSVDTWGGRPGWDSHPDLVRAGLVIAPRRGALSELLRRDPRFELAYEDGVATVFVARR